MLYQLLADVIVALHLAYLAFLIVGGFLAWRWRWMLWLHLAAAAWALVVVVTDLRCPLTVVEKDVRRLGTGGAYPGTFIGHYIAGTIYPDGYTRVAEYVLLGIVLAAYAALVARRLSRTRSHG